MSYTIKRDGMEIVCTTLDEFRTAISVLNGATPPPAKSGSKPSGSKPSATPPKVSSRPHARRRVDDKTYLRLGWKAVRFLLAAPAEVGKMMSSFYTELGVSSTTTKFILMRLCEEKPPFMTIDETRRGQSAWVRISDRDQAIAYMNTKEAEYKASVAAELEK